MNFGSSVADDLRNHGGMVAVHNDYRLNGINYTFWQITFPLGPKKGNSKHHLVALIGEGRTDAEALDIIRTEYLELVNS